MSAEMISTVLVAASVLIALGGGLFAGLAWVLKRMEHLFAKVDERFEKIDKRFDKVDARFAKVDERFDRVDERLIQLQSELNDVKVAVARLEGPPPRLYFPR